MRDFLKDFFRGFFYALEEFPVITGMFFVLLSIYSIRKILPKAYNIDYDKVSAYYYWNNLGLAFLLTFFSLIISIIQLIKIIKKLLNHL